MSTSEEPQNKRSRMSDKEMDEMTKEELISLWRTQEQYIDSLEAKSGSGETLAALEEKVKQSARREQLLVMRLTTKEHEMQEYLNQIQELKQAHSHSTGQLRQLLLDPAVNLMFERMKKELEETKQKLEQTKNDLSAWKFTADSQTGKRLMAKCRMLLQENEELGKITSSGRIAKLEGTIALEKTLVQEMKKGQAEIDDFLMELEEDLEGMQSTIYLQQQQLKDAKEEIRVLKEENDALKQHPVSTRVLKEENDALKQQPVSCVKLEPSDNNEGIMTEKPDPSHDIVKPEEMMDSDPVDVAPVTTENVATEEVATEESDAAMEVDKSQDEVTNDTAESSGTEELESSQGSPGSGTEESN